MRAGLARDNRHDDLSAATALIDATNRIGNQMVTSVLVSGSGASRVIYLVNNNPSDARRGVIRYDIGANATMHSGDTGAQVIGPGCFARAPRDVARDSNGDWYVVQYSATSGVVPPITRFLDGAPPLNTPAWEAPKSYVGASGLDIHEPRGWVAYADSINGRIHILDMLTGAFIDQFDALGDVPEIAFDAAGNIVTVDRASGWLRAWSPAGANSFTTESYFEIAPEPSSLLALLVVAPYFLRRKRVWSAAASAPL